MVGQPQAQVPEEFYTDAGRQPQSSPPPGNDEGLEFQGTEDWQPMLSVGGIDQAPLNDEHERIGRVQEGTRGDFTGEMTDAEEEEINLDPMAGDEEGGEETEVEEGEDFEEAEDGVAAETDEEAEDRGASKRAGSRPSKQKGGSAKVVKTRSASAHPRYKLWLTKTSRRSRSIVMIRYPMASAEEEADAIQEAWTRETRGGPFEGKRFPDKFDLVVGARHLLKWYTHCCLRFVSITQQ